MHNFGLCRKIAAVAAFFLHVPKLCADLDAALLYILIFRTYSKFVWKNKKKNAKGSIRSACALRRHARVLATCLPHQGHVSIFTDELFVSTKLDPSKCLVKWMPLRTQVLSRCKWVLWDVSESFEMWVRQVSHSTCKYVFRGASESSESRESFEMSVSRDVGESDVSESWCKWIVRDANEACQSFKMQVRHSKWRWVLRDVSELF